tara:strand:- start:2826 stop:3392 length:567 start_codon:yes stop_codon:yes gene_type:complete
MRIISGRAKGKKLEMPTSKKTRPLKDIVRGAIFNIIEHSNLLSSRLNGCVILDLFSGVGSFGLEAISRGAKKVVFFEDFGPTLDFLYKNVENLSFNKMSEIYKKNIYNVINFKNINYKFDIVFLDPPFKDRNINIILNKLVNSKVLSDKTLIIIHRHKKMIDDFEGKLNILREEIYGSSKIIFGLIIF